MAASLSETLRVLQTRLNDIERKMQGQAELIADLEAENQLLVEENEELKEKLQASEADEEFLRISRLIAGTPDDIAMARVKLAKMIRTVNECIDILERGEI